MLINQTVCQTYLQLYELGHKSEVSAYVIMSGGLKLQFSLLLLMT